MGNYKWFSKEDLENSTRVIFMVSRNKDNKNIEGFKERKKSFISKKSEDKIRTIFSHFVEEGVKGEFCRLYLSLNSRDTSKLRKELLHLLIDKEDFDFEYIDAVIAGIAARKENALESKWFFDFDSLDENILTQVLGDICLEAPDVNPAPLRTPNGYAIVVDHGFDTRRIMDKYGDIMTLKRDDLICIDWRVKE